MPVPATIADLSTTAASNSPSGSETPAEGDNHFKAVYSFIAQIRDKLDGTANAGTLKNPIISGTISTDTTGLGIGLARAKSATTSRSGTTTYADDPHLVVPLGAGSWAIDMFVPIWATTAGTGGFKTSMAFSGTATSATFAYLGNFNGSAMPANTTIALGGGVSASSLFVSTGVSGSDWIRVQGLVVVTVAGLLSMQWAQNSSNANAANVGAGGWINCVKAA